MNKSLLVFSFVLVLSISVYGQESQTTNYYRDPEQLFVYVEGSQMQMTSMANAGLFLQVDLLKWMAVNYHIGIGMASNGAFYVHAPFGATLSMLFFKDGSSWAVAAGTFILLIPEGISFHIAPEPDLTISPYINPLGMDYFKNKRTFGDSLIMCGEMGARVKFHFAGKMFLAPYLAVKMYYNHAEIGLEAGINITFQPYYDAKKD